MSRKVDDWIATYMDYTSNTESPLLYRKWSAIHVIAAAMERKCVLPWGSLTFYPNMYIILIGPSGKARKGTAMGPALDILMDIPGINLAAEAITREALIQELREAGAEPTIVTGGKMVFHASLTVHSQELTVFLGYNNYALMSDLTDWYDCRKKWTYRTKHQGTDEINGLWVNLLGATTPELIQSSMPIDAIGGGLTSRMIFVFEFKKGKIVPDPFLSKEEIALQEVLMSEIEKIHMLHGKFHVTENFVGLWGEWYTAQEDNPPFQDIRFNGYFERRPNHVMKLSMILNASRTDAMIITEGDLLNSIELLNQTERKMPHTFKGVGRSSQAETLAKVMAHIGMAGDTNFEELMVKFHFDASRDEMEQIIKTLESMRFCQKVVGSGVIRYIGTDDTYDQKMNTARENEGR